jgi:hypothetical protein
LEGRELMVNTDVWPVEPVVCGRSFDAALPPSLMLVSKSVRTCRRDGNSMHSCSHRLPVRRSDQSTQLIWILANHTSEMVVTR